MRPPPEVLYGAKILFWTATDSVPFYYVQSGTEAIPVAAMAIGQYDYSECYQLFTCDPEWNVINDRDALSLQEASQIAATNAHSHLLKWLERTETN